MPQNRPEMEKIWDLIADYRRMDSEGLIHSMAHHLEFSPVSYTHLTLPTTVFV